MNAIAQQFEVLDQTLALRHQLTDILTDADLAFAVDNNPTLGALCHEIWQIEQSYIESFKTYKQDWMNIPAKPELESSVDALKAAYVESEARLKDTLNGIPDADVNSKMVERTGFSIPVGAQFHIYREALLIFYGRVDVYLRAMDKTRPQQWQLWISR